MILADEKRYTVHVAQLPMKDGWRKAYLILDDGLPAVHINKAILPDKDYQRTPSSSQYNLCRYLNYLNDRSIEYTDATMEDIYSFLKTSARYYSWSQQTVNRYINVIGKLYETLSVLGYTLDSSLYSPMKGCKPISAGSRREEPDTKIWSLKRLFRTRVNRSWDSYTKWYTPEQINALCEELPLVHRIIFLMTVYFGYRSSTALSIVLPQLNLRTRKVTPTYSKTQKVHTSVMPDDLVEMIRSYMENERSMNKGSGSKYLFINKQGNRMQYHSYNAALKRAAEKVREKHPELELDNVHTHAGRSTFAAALRSFQLEKRRLGEKTFADEDFCALMDWKDLSSLSHYDKATRIQDSYDIFATFQDDLQNVLKENETNYTGAGND